MTLFDWLDCFFFDHRWKYPMRLHQGRCIRCGKAYEIPSPPQKGWLEK